MIRTADRPAPEPGNSDPSEGSLSDRAHAELSRLILTKTLPGGAVVVEGRLSRTLNISRTPMREAILRLAAEGLLVRKGSRSYEVRRVEPVEFFQALKVRELLEAEAVGRAVGHVPAATLEALRTGVARLADRPRQEKAHWTMDDAVHLTLADAPGNGVLGRMIRHLRVSTRLFELTSPAGRVAADAAEHLAILDAVAAGNAAGARDAMVTHLRNVAAEILAVVGGR